MSTTNSKERAKQQKKLKVVDDKILKQTHFIPKQKMQQFFEVLEERRNKTDNHVRCSYNLVDLQESRLGGDAKRFERLWSTNIKRPFYVLACYKALYAQDWNKLLYLLKKVPSWQLVSQSASYKFFYPRLQMILLMYHPMSQKTGALNDFLHMAWGCRNESEKKAVLKVLLMLLKKIPRVPQSTRND